MKRILFIIATMTLLLATSCKNKHEEMSFTFSNPETTENSVKVTVTPSDSEQDYFLGILPSTEVKTKEDAQIIAEVGNYDGFKKYKGTQTYALNGLQAETDYVALAFCSKDAEKVSRYTMRTLVAQDTVPEIPETPTDTIPEKPEIPTDTIPETPEIPADTIPETPETPTDTIPEEPETVVELSADKTEIYNDGNDKATFTVKVNGEIVTEGYKLVNVEDNTEVNDNVFSSTERGSYTFVATYEDLKSNEITIDVIAKLRLVADKDVLKTNGTDKITFRVWFEDGWDKTKESVIFNVTDNVALEGNTFTTDKLGTYEFNATYEGITTENITINVEEGKIYNVGDIYDVNGVKGVVFYVENGGVNGLVMSMDQETFQWSTENFWANCVSLSGESNTETMHWLGIDKFPAAKWCVEHGEGWFMPSSEEMHLMWAAVSDGKYEFDSDFVNKNYNDKLEDPILQDYYWSSNEVSEGDAEVVAFMGRSVVCLEPFKSKKFNVRAVYKF